MNIFPLKSRLSIKSRMDSIQDLIQYGDHRLNTFFDGYSLDTNFKTADETTLEITSTFRSSADTMTRSRALASPRESPRGDVGEHTCRVNRHLSSFMGNFVRGKAASLRSLSMFSIFLLSRLSSLVHALVIILREMSHGLDASECKTIYFSISRTINQASRRFSVQMEGRSCSSF